MFYVKKVFRSFRNAATGLREAYKRDLSFRMEIAAGFFFILIGISFWPLDNFELALFILSYVLVLMGELINTSIEEALEHLHPHGHERIGISKDIASAAVFIAVLFAVFSVVLVAYRHLV